MSGTGSPSSTPTGRLSSLSEVEHGSPNRNSSRLNPNATPPVRTTALPPFHDDGMPLSSSPHLRGRTISATSEGGLYTDPLWHVGRGASSLSLPSSNVDEMRSTVRERSRSPGRSLLDATSQEAEANLKSSWWAEKHVSRPWQDSPKRKQTVPKEQTEAFQSTRTVRTHFICRPGRSLIFSSAESSTSSRFCFGSRDRCPS